MAMLNFQTISIADAIRVIQRNAMMNEVTALLAQCGVGKTSIAHALKNKPELNIHYVLDFNGQTRETFDIQGIPHTIKDADGGLVTDWAVMEEFKKIVRLAKEGKRSAIIIDEFTNCNEVMLGSLQRLILEKMAGSLDLKVNGIEPVIVVCGNRPEDNSNYNEVPLAFWDRVRPYEVTADADVTIEYAKENNWHWLVLAYMQTNPSCINEGWMPDCLVSFTPRSAEVLSKNEEQGIPKDLELPIIQSIMGAERATEYVAFRRVANEIIPKEEVYNDPQKARLPDPKRPDLSYSMVNMLSAFMKKENATATVQYMNRWEDKDFAVLCISDAVKRDKTLYHNADVKQFAMANMETFSDLLV